MNNVSILMFSFIIAFNTLILEFSMASFITSILSGEIFLYPLVIILYLLGMGFGAFIKRNPQTKEIKQLIRLEISVAILTWLGFIGLNYLSYNSPLLFLPFLTIICLVQGFLIGQELPLIFSISKNLKLERKILAVDYAASLIATIIFILIIIPYINFYYVFWGLSCFTLCSILFLNQDSKYYFLIVAVTIIIPMTYSIERYQKDRFNLYPKETIIKNFKTKYQEITIVAHDLKNNSKIDEQVILNKKNDFIIKAYLNNIYQFQVTLSYPHDQYHYEMINPVIKTFHHIQKVLILGGGDGLPAKELLNFEDQIDSIDIIDIDKDWYNFSKNNLLMKEVNHNSLNNKKVNFINGNAFSETKKINKKYDLIIIDFPEGESLESLRIHSIEFTTTLKSLLSERGIILSQEDTFTDKESSQLIANTLISSNLNTLFGSYNRGEEYLIQFISFKDPTMIAPFMETNKNRKIKYKKMKLQGDIISYSNPTIIQARIKSFINEIVQGLIK